MKKKCICNKCLDFNPWLLYNEKVVDFIRWKELWAHVFILIVLIVLFGLWKGLILNSLLYWFTHLNGGMMVDFFEEHKSTDPPQPVKCKDREKHKYCHMKECY